MSDTQPQHSPLQRMLDQPFLLVVGASVALMVLLLSVLWVSKNMMGQAANMSEEAVIQRIAPVAAVVVEANTGPKELKTGEEVYKAQCSACHAIGAAGAPKFGDAAAWAPRIATGFEALWKSALKGKNAMPPQGGGALDDIEVARGVVFMTTAAGGKFKEPAAPAAKADAKADTKAAAPAAEPAKK
jgi:cytochrome c5